MHDNLVWVKREEAGRGQAQGIGRPRTANRGGGVHKRAISRREGIEGIEDGRLIGDAEASRFYIKTPTMAAREVQLGPGEGCFRFQLWWSIWGFRVL